MPEPTDLPRWATDAGRTTEPVSAKKDVGWVAGEEPAPEHMNWLQNNLYEWMIYVQEIAADVAAETLATRREGVLNWFPSEMVNPGGTVTMHDIAVDDGGSYVMVGVSGTIYQSVQDRTGYWLSRTGDATTKFGVAHDQSGVWVAVGSTGTIISSTDGVTWTTRTAAGGYTGGFLAVVHTASTWVIVGATGEIQTSPDGTTWTARTAAGGYTGSFTDVAFGAGLYVAVGTAGEIQTSPDGTTWTARTADASFAQSFEAVTFENSLFVAVGYNGEVQTSTNGTTWTQRATSTNTQSLNAVAYSTQHTAWVAMGGAAGNLLISLDDGVTWEFGESGAPVFLRQVIFTPNEGLALYETGETYRSLRY